MYVCVGKVCFFIFCVICVSVYVSVSVCLSFSRNTFTESVSNIDGSIAVYFQSSNESPHTFPFDGSLTSANCELLSTRSITVLLSSSSNRCDTL